MPPPVIDSYPVEPTAWVHPSGVYFGSCGIVTFIS